MTEKERMIAGHMYDPDSFECARDRTRAHSLCYTLNNTRPSDSHTRRGILKDLLPNAAPDAVIPSPFQCQFGYNIIIGKNFRAGTGLVITDNTRVTFGDNVTVGSGCIFLTPVHPMSYEKRNTYRIFCLPVTVGSNVRIGSEVKVLPGVAIGDNVTLMTGSIVHHDIPDNCIAGGNPCRIIRRLATEEIPSD